MWKPDWLYEFMPYVYSLAGIAAMYHFDTFEGYGAGVLLLAAAAFIWKMRKENRSLKRVRN